jgi:hypothetical protein
METGTWHVERQVGKFQSGAWGLFWHVLQGQRRLMHMQLTAWMTKYRPLLVPVPLRTMKTGTSSVYTL